MKQRRLYGLVVHGVVQRVVHGAVPVAIAGVLLIFGSGRCVCVGEDKTGAAVSICPVNSASVAKMSWSPTSAGDVAAGGIVEPARVPSPQ